MADDRPIGVLEAAVRITEAWLQANRSSAMVPDDIAVRGFEKIYDSVQRKFEEVRSR